jgi:hypothetical protein
MPSRQVARLETSLRKELWLHEFDEEYSREDLSQAQGRFELNIPGWVTRGNVLGGTYDQVVV